MQQRLVNSTSFQTKILQDELILTNHEIKHWNYSCKLTDLNFVHVWKPALVCGQVTKSDPNLSVSPESPKFIKATYRCILSNTILNSL